MKNELRKNIKAKRKILFDYFLENKKEKDLYYLNTKENLISILNKHYFENQNNMKIAVFYPLKYEYDILSILPFNDIKYDLLFPRIENEIALFYEIKDFNKEDNFVITNLKIKEPNPSLFKKDVKPDIIIVPLLAFDKNRNRLGYGKGHYDKTLSYLNSINHKFKTISISHSSFLIENIDGVFDDRDYKIDYIVTEKYII